MTNPTFKSLFAMAIGLMLFSMAGKADAQVLVYKLEFRKTGTSINYSFFEQAYLVANALDGTGTFVFTGEETIDGVRRKVFTQADDVARLFVAVKQRDGKTDRKLVMRAIADNDSAQAQYLAIGDLNTTVRGRTNQLSVTVRAARTLKGFLVASDDESSIATIPDDGSLGFAGFARISGSLQKQPTEAANQQSLTVAEVVADIVADLEIEGFIDPDEDAEETSTEEESTDEESDA